MTTQPRQDVVELLVSQHNTANARLAEEDQAKRALSGLEKVDLRAGAPESAMGNMVIGPFVAIADRVRDVLRKHE